MISLGVLKEGFKGEEGLELGLEAKEGVNRPRANVPGRTQVS